MRARLLSAPRSPSFAPLGAVLFIPFPSDHLCAFRPASASRRVLWPNAESRIVVAVVDHAVLALQRNLFVTLTFVRPSC